MFVKLAGHGENLNIGVLSAASKVTVIFPNLRDVNLYQFMELKFTFPCQFCILDLISRPQQSDAGKVELKVIICHYVLIQLSSDFLWTKDQAQKVVQKIIFVTFACI